jgi:4-diphosphocytidyl-2C-methyl-D-erythritol kinase
LMSGSGPSVVGLFNQNEQAQAAWQELKHQYQETYLVSSYYGGE